MLHRLGGVDDEVGTGRGLHDDPTVGEHVPDAADDERGVAQTVELGLEPLDLALEPEDLRLHVVALALHPLDGLGELGVPKLEEVDTVERIVRWGLRFRFAHGFPLRSPLSTFVIQ